MASIARSSTCERTPQRCAERARAQAAQRSSNSSGRAPAQASRAQQRCLSPMLAMPHAAAFRARFAALRGQTHHSIGNRSRCRTAGRRVRASPPRIRREASARAPDGPLRAKVEGGGPHAWLSWPWLAPSRAVPQR
eukprot:1166616-Pleurochrysis_carterae.AAC.1